MIEGGVQAVSLKAVEVIEAGDLAVEIGRYTLATRTAGAELGIDKGKSVVVWRRQQDGAIEIAIDTFTSDTGP